jgi:predicted lipid-binding transport protein (Tim44 family)
MRYTRLALLLFGAGLLLGLAVVSANLSSFARIASLTMAAGVLMLPIALVADWRRRAPRPKRKAKSAKTKRRAQPRSSRPRKSSPAGKRGSRRK